MRSALALLTTVGGARDPDEHTLTWFPVVGGLLGAAIGGVWLGAEQLWPAAVAAGIVVAADLAITGMLHLDGLVDTADGLVGHLPRQRRLEVMAEPTVGAFGVAAAAAVLLLRFAALASMAPDVALVAALWCLSRTLMAVAARAVPSARPGGLADTFGRGEWRTVAVYGTAGSLLLAFLAGVPAVAAVGAALVAGSGVVAFGWARLRGCTGDVLGAAGLVAETVGLVVAAARW